VQCLSFRSFRSCNACPSGRPSGLPVVLPVAARSDGGTHRADWSATAFARLKSVIVTGMKNRVRFIQYEIEVVRAKLRGEQLPLPSAATTDTS
jgi:hypothetical protein